LRSFVGSACQSRSLIRVTRSRLCMWWGSFVRATLAHSFSPRAGRRLGCGGVTARLRLADTPPHPNCGACHRAGHFGPNPLAIRPLPAQRGEERIESRSRDAAARPSYAKPLQKVRPFTKAKGAERRKAQCLGAAPCEGAAARFCESALASRRSTAALTEALTLRLNPGPRFLELPGANARTLPGASAASTSQAGRSAGRYDARSRPGAKLRASPAGTARAPSQDRL
jgi:hypothetical protein